MNTRLLPSHLALLGLKLACGTVLLTSMMTAVAGEYTNFIGMKFVDIPAGSFRMGNCPDGSDAGLLSSFRGCSITDEEAEPTEYPPHSVQVRAFQMGKYEVTFAQFRRYLEVMGETRRLQEPEFAKNNAYGDKAPVLWVSWYDAQLFIDWLNNSKPDSDKGNYRLPSEAEWEYACKAGKEHRYCGGNSPNGIGWHFDNSDVRPQPVGMRRANAFGLHDMSGNAHEWVADCWHENYRNAPDDARPWEDGRAYCATRVMRGGSFGDITATLRATYRSNLNPNNREVDYGFRVVRDLR